MTRGGRPPVGLCARCRYRRWIRSDRGSDFLLCRLSRTDARFRRYPTLPVLRCAGFRAEEEETP